MKPTALLAAALLAACAFVDAPREERSSLGSEGTRLRVVAANLTSGTGMDYDPGHGARILKGLAPDVVLIQEFNYGDGSDVALHELVGATFGPEFGFTRGSGAIPNGVISRYPIVAAGEWEDVEAPDREFVWARIDVPGAPDLWAVSLHLISSSSTRRLNEAQAVVRQVEAIVPPGDLLAIGGDLNTGGRGELSVGALGAVVTTTGPYPADQYGNTATNSTRTRPYDWVLADPDLAALAIPVTLGASTFASGLVADTRVYSPIAELAPALADDSGAYGMQHMAVVRDFLLPPVTSLALEAPNGGERWTEGDEVAIRWAASGMATVRAELSMDGGASWNEIATVDAGAGGLSWTVPAGLASDRALVRVSDATDGALADVSDGPFTIVPVVPARVFVNEVCANEPGSSVAGEFVEILNVGGQDADLSGWTLWDATAVRHTFAPGTRLAAGRALVVLGGPSAVPPGLGNAVVASTGGLSLANAGDSVFLRDASGAAIDGFAYGSTLAGLDGVSMNRQTDGDPGSALVLHSRISAAPSSPGTRATGEPW